MGTLFVFNGICFPLDIRKHDFSKCSEHKTEVSVGCQSILLSFSIQASKSFVQESLETYKQNDKCQNFQYFCRFSQNDDLFHFLTITCKNDFRRMSDVLFHLQNMQHEAGSPNAVGMLLSFKETLKPVRLKHSSLK